MAYSEDARLHRNLLVPVGDAEVALNRYESTVTDDPKPTIVISTPYRKDDRITFGSWDPSIRYFTKHGYDVAVMDLLGTGASTGTREPFDPSGGQEEATVIEWIADQEWSTGNIGTFGLSHGAYTQYLTARADPDPLKAIVPVAVVPSPYYSSVSGGVFNVLKRATWAVSRQTQRSLPPSYRDEEGRWSDVWHERLNTMANEKPWLFHFLEHETKDEFWTAREVKPEDVKVPVLAGCGYRDVHTGPMVDFVRDIETPKRLHLGPWRHTMPHKGRETPINWRQLAVEWYDHYLQGEETKALDRPAVSYWTEREGGWTPKGEWRSADTWPPTDDATRFALADDGLAPEDEYTGEPVEREYEYDHTVGMESLDRIGSIANDGEPTNADDARSLVFETDPLDTAYEVTGVPEASIRLRATTSDPILAVRVVDVDTDGIGRPISTGYIRTSHRNSHSDPEPLVEGDEYRVEFALKPRSHVFEEGHRIRTAIAASFWPRTLSTPEQGSFTVLSDPSAPSYVTLPGQFHEEVAFDNVITPKSPDLSVPTSSQYAGDSYSGWETSRRHNDKVGSIDIWGESSLNLPHGATMSFESGGTASVKANEPRSASLRYQVDWTLEHGDELIAASSKARVSREFATLETEVEIDGVTVFDEEWHHRPF